MNVNHQINSGFNNSLQQQLNLTSCKMNILFSIIEDLLKLNHELGFELNEIHTRSRRKSIIETNQFPNNSDEKSLKNNIEIYITKKNNNIDKLLLNDYSPKSPILKAKSLRPSGAFTANYQESICENENLNSFRINRNYSEALKLSELKDFVIKSFSEINNLKKIFQNTLISIDQYTKKLCNSKEIGASKINEFVKSESLEFKSLRVNESNVNPEIIQTLKTVNPNSKLKNFLSISNDDESDQKLIKNPGFANSERNFFQAKDENKHNQSHRSGSKNEISFSNVKKNEFVIEESKKNSINLAEATKEKKNISSNRIQTIKGTFNEKIKIKNNIKATPQNFIEKNKTKIKVKSPRRSEITKINTPDILIQSQSIKTSRNKDFDMLNYSKTIDKNQNDFISKYYNPVINENLTLDLSTNLYNNQITQSFISIHHQSTNSCLQRRGPSFDFLQPKRINRLNLKNQDKFNSAINDYLETGTATKKFDGVSVKVESNEIKFFVEGGLNAKNSINPPSHSKIVKVIGDDISVMDESLA